MKKRQYILIAAFIPFVMVVDQSFVFADTAISVPRDAHMTIESAKNDMAKIEEKKKEFQYKKDASDYVNNMQAAYTEAQLNLVEMQKKEKMLLLNCTKQKSIKLLRKKRGMRQSRHMTNLAKK